jgi:hypothetical protein
VDHLPWCVGAYCTADRPLFKGHEAGAHRSSPAAVDGLLMFVRRSAGAGVVPDGLELPYGAALMVVPPSVARQLPVAVDELLEAAGVQL